MTLGLDASCSTTDIKRAYRSLAMKFHPDKNAGDASATAKFQEVGEAYRVLSDPDQRAKVDRGEPLEREEEEEAPPAPSSADFVADLFSFLAGVVGSDPIKVEFHNGRIRPCGFVDGGTGSKRGGPRSTFGGSGGERGATARRGAAPGAFAATATPTARATPARPASAGDGWRGGMATASTAPAGPPPPRSQSAAGPAWSPGPFGAGSTRGAAVAGTGSPRAAPKGEPSAVPGDGEKVRGRGCKGSRMRSGAW